MAVVSAAAIFADAGTLNLLEAAIPGGPGLLPIPGIGAYGLALALYLLAGPSAASAPTGILSVGTTPGPGDGAILIVAWTALGPGARADRAERGRRVPRPLA